MFVLRYKMGTDKSRLNPEQSSDVAYPETKQKQLLSEKLPCQESHNPRPPLAIAKITFQPCSAINKSSSGLCFFQKYPARALWSPQPTSALELACSAVRADSAPEQRRGWRGRQTRRPQCARHAASRYLRRAAPQTPSGRRRARLVLRSRPGATPVGAGRPPPPSVVSGADLTPEPTTTWLQASFGTAPPVAGTRAHYRGPAAR